MNPKVKAVLLILATFPISVPFLIVGGLVILFSEAMDAISWAIRELSGEREEEERRTAAYHEAVARWRAAEAVGRGDWYAGLQNGLPVTATEEVKADLHDVEVSVPDLVQDKEPTPVVPLGT